MTTAVDWDVKHQFKQTNKTFLMIGLPGIAPCFRVLFRLRYSVNQAVHLFGQRFHRFVLFCFPVTPINQFLIILGRCTLYTPVCLQDEPTCMRIEPV